ncbi:hypothetical protein MNV49_005799 [Pseudohyphozyma bogoriensis]|nr:hypothetical protein MNV49_005799 [Pseudohyphozyma bogoriensis]
MILDPCTCSVETSRSVSPAQDDDGHSKRARRRVQLDGKAFKREGRVITKLRLHQGPTAKLVHTELATSLTYHLIQSATGYILAANSPPSPLPEPTTPDELGLYAPEHDAFTAVLHRQPPTIIKSTGHLNLHLLAHDFRNLFRLLDDVELGMSLIAAAEDEAVCEDWGKKLGCYLSSVPMLAEACLAFEATQLGEHEIAKELREETRGRFVRWLKRFIWLTKDAQFTTAEGAHARALMLSLLDVFPGWIETAVDAARQQSASESVGASTSITSNDLHDLLRSLESSSSVFAQSSQQKAALFKALLKYPSYARKHASSAASVVEATLQELK